MRWWKACTSCQCFKQFLGTAINSGFGTDVRYALIKKCSRVNDVRLARSFESGVNGWEFTDDSQRRLPWCGAAGGLKWNWMPLNEENCWIFCFEPSELREAWTIWRGVDSTPMKSDPHSEKISEQNPLWDTMREKVAMNASEVKLVTSSKCTAFVSRRRRYKNTRLHVWLLRD